MAEATKPVPPRPPPAELKPILGGRLWLAVAMLAGFGALANPVVNNWVIQKLAPPEDLHTDFARWKLGSETEVRVTIVTADANRLSCAGPPPMGEAASSTVPAASPPGV